MSGGAGFVVKVSAFVAAARLPAKSARSPVSTV
jgi:hypothetical protein